MATFSQRLRELRDQGHMTQEELADKISIGKQAISQYELGKRRPEFDTLLELADLFNVSTDYLLGKTDITLRLLTPEDLAKLDYQTSEFDRSLLSAYHSASEEAKAMVRFALGLKEEKRVEAKIS